MVNHLCILLLDMFIWPYCTQCNTFNNSTVLPRLSDTLGTKTCLDNQKVWVIKQIKTHDSES